MIPDRMQPSHCYDYPLRPGFVAQVVLPRNFTTADAERLCAFIMTLAFTPPAPQNGSNK